MSIPVLHSLGRSYYSVLSLLVLLTGLSLDLLIALSPSDRSAIFPIVASTFFLLVALALSFYPGCNSRDQKLDQRFKERHLRSDKAVRIVYSYYLAVLYW
jgi:hypothetical protein